MKLLILGHQTLLSAITVWLFISNAWAAPSITLSTAVERTIEKSIVLQSYPYYLRAMEGRSVQAGLKPNPTINLELENIFGSGQARALAGAEWTLALGQVIELGG